MLNKETLEKLISEKFPGIYNPGGMSEIIYTIEHSDEKIKNALEQFFTKDVEPSMEVEGYTYAYLKTHFGMNPIAALLTLDYLIKQPEEAKKSLQGMHDHVSLGK